MPAFKAPDFNERIAAAGAARKKALDQLRNRPAQDPAIAAQRLSIRHARETAEAGRRAAKQAAIEAANAAEDERLAQEARAKAEAEAAAQAAATAAEEARIAALPKVPTAAELKAACDARYAARKARR